MKHVVRIAGAALGVFSLVGSLGGEAIAGLQQTRLVSRNVDGTFLVVCISGETETATSQEILSNDICDGSTSSNQPNPTPESQANQLTCTGSAFFDDYYITRLADETTLGSTMPLEKCRQIIAEATDEYVCSGNDFFDDYYITRIADGSYLGEEMPLATCRQLIEDI